MPSRPLLFPIAPLLAAVALAAAPALAEDGTVEPEPATVEASSATYVGDANSNWAHIGGGFGAANTASLSLDGLSTAAQVPQGRISFGGGGYTFGFYGGGGIDLTFSEVLPFRLDAYGVLGIHIPIPVVHPLIGFKGGVGFGAFGAGAGIVPAINLGAHIGVIVREFDRRVGIRVNLEPGVVLVGSLAGVVAAGEIMGTVAFVY